MLPWRDLKLVGVSATDGTYRPAPSPEKREDREWPQQDPEPMQGPIASVGAHREIVALNLSSIDPGLHNARFVYPCLPQHVFSVLPGRQKIKDVIVQQAQT